MRFSADLQALKPPYRDCKVAVTNTYLSRPHFCTAQGRHGRTFLQCERRVGLQCNTFIPRMLTVQGISKASFVVIEILSSLGRITATWYSARLLMVSLLFCRSSLCSCSVPDVKLQLSPAYGDFLASLPPNPSTSSLANKTTDKLVAEFRYLQAQAVGTLAKFMEYLTYGYMIDNVALLITGTLHERDTRELLERCHPLGWFETMPVLCVATNIEELYNSVLIETPLAPYFKGSLSHQDLDELNIEIIRNTLYKNYLEDFYRFVTEHPELRGTPTSEVMAEVLEFEADRRAINITINSFGTELSKQDRKKLYPEFGGLYPEGTLMLSRADDLEGVSLAVSGNHDYKSYFDQIGMSGGTSGVGNMSGGGGAESKSLEDMFYQKEMEISKTAFTRQFTHAVIYAWVKLREQVSFQE